MNLLSKVTLAVPAFHVYMDTEPLVRLFSNHLCIILMPAFSSFFLYCLFSRNYFKLDLNKALRLFSVKVKKTFYNEPSVSNLHRKNQFISFFFSLVPFKLLFNWPSFCNSHYRNLYFAASIQPKTNNWLRVVRWWATGEAMVFLASFF